MPSGRSHDAITILLAGPFAVGAYAITRDLSTAVIAAVAFIFAGIMFGPDLDTKSKQYSRWGPFRIVWIPYRAVFRHRSRWSHGMIFGTLFRVIYFLGVVSLLGIFAWSGYTYGTTGEIPGGVEFLRGWKSIGHSFSTDSMSALLVAVVAGMWSGAASHTITDVSITYIKTGRVDALF